MEAEKRNAQAMAVGSFVAYVVEDSFNHVVQVWDEEMNNVLGTFPIGTQKEVIDVGFRMYVLGYKTGQNNGRITLQQNLRKLLDLC